MSAQILRVVILIASDKQTGGPEQHWAALADPTRRRILELLAEAPRTASEIHRAFTIADPAVSRHLRVLREGGLISERRLPEDGRIRMYSLEQQPLRELAGWLADVGSMWQGELESFKDYVALRAGRSEKDAC